MLFMRTTETHIFFFGGIYSNFHSCLITWNENIYKSSEQLYMARKALYFDDYDSFNKILETTNPLKAKKLGRKVKNFSQESWDKVKLEVMTEVCFEKFYQNPELKKELCSNNKILVEASPYDAIWGIKLAECDDRVLDESKWQGQNLLGIALMNVRNKLNKNLD